MKRSLFALATAAALAIGTVGAANAQTNPPLNPEACVGNSSTTANVIFQPIDPDKLRSDQARADDGQPGRAETFNNGTTPQCNTIHRGVVNP